MWQGAARVPSELRMDPGWARKWESQSYIYPKLNSANNHVIWSSRKECSSAITYIAALWDKPVKILLVFGGLPHKLAALMQILAEAPILGTALPGFRDCNPPWLRLSERPWDPTPLRRQSLSPWQGHCLCLLYFTLPGPQCKTGLPMMGKIPEGRDDLRQAWSQASPQERTWGAMEERGDGPSPLRLALSWPESSFCLQEVS